MVAWSLFMANLTNYGIAGDLNGLQRMLLFALVFLGSLAIIFYLASFATNRFNRNCKSRLYSDVFNAVFHKNSVEFGSVHSGVYISLMNNDLEQLYTQYVTPWVSIILQALTFIVASLALVFYDYRLFLIQLLLSALPFIKTAIVGSRVAKEQEKFLQTKSSYVSRIKDLFTAHEILSTGKTKVKVMDIHRNASGELFTAEEKFGNVNAVASTLSTVFHYIDGIGFLLMASFLLAKGEIVIGTMVGAMQISNYVKVPAMQITSFFTQIVGIKPVKKRIEHILNEGNQIEGFVPEVINEEILPINYQNYGVNYEEDVILRDINLTLEKGKKYAIVGPSGAGKSTFLKSVMQYFDAQHHTGTQLYAGVPADSLNTETLSNKIAYVEQKVFLFEGSLKDNIGLFMDYPEEKISNILNSIHGTRFLENGKLSDIHIQEMGKNLSGGEIQKIAIGRALLQEKEIFLCDEITANIDKKAASDIYRALLSNRDITLLNISHQMDQEFLTSFDEILFIDSKTILEQGSFDELMKKQNFFYHYWSYYTSVEE